MDSLEERIIRLEAIEAIKQLKSHYALCADAKYTDCLLYTSDAADE